MTSSENSGVPGYLARVLDGDGVAVGTAFQVAPGTLVTACHVLEGMACTGIGDRLRVDPLGGGEALDAEVLRVDPGHDLACLQVGKPLPGPAPILVGTDTVMIRTDVVVTGVVDMADPGHDYRHADAPGTWQGHTVRNGAPLGSLESKNVMPGMSGAPVHRSDDGAVVGVVSARYNSADGWGRDTVWVVRIEDVLPLVPGTVLHVSDVLPTDLRAELAQVRKLTEDGVLLPEAGVRIQFERYMEFTRRPSR